MALLLSMGQASLGRRKRPKRNLLRPGKRCTAALAARARTIGPADLSITAITLAEMWFGAAKNHQPRRTRSDQEAFLAPFRVLDFDAVAADFYASIRAHLTAKGRPIGDRDRMCEEASRVRSQSRCSSYQLTRSPRSETLPERTARS